MKGVASVSTFEHNIYFCWFNFFFSDAKVRISDGGYNSYIFISYNQK